MQNRVVADTIALIQQRGYAPGERLPSERELAERFAVNRGAIREALSVLETMRYVERKRSSGLYRADDPSLETLVLSHDLGLPIDRQEITDSLEVRRLIEVQAVQLACARRSDADLARLDEILAASTAAIKEGRSIAAQDYDFHMAIFRATQNDILVRVVKPFYLMSRQRREKFFEHASRCRGSHRQHIQLAAAIAARKPKHCVQLMDAHIGRVERYYLDQQEDQR
jgi:GntR family transcriptional regulator, transcriptional repressor for pyruvate dehydrogenase complex